MVHFNFRLVDKKQRVDLGQMYTERCDERVQDKNEAEQSGFVVGEENHEVSWQESKPSEDRGCHRYEDVPGLVEVVREFAGEEPEDSAQEKKQHVEGKRNEQIVEREVAQKFHILD